MRANRKRCGQSQAPACFSARSPITGNLNICPWYAFNTKTSQMTNPARPMIGHSSNVNQPKMGTCTRMFSAMDSANHARAKKRHWNAWNRTKRLRLNGSKTKNIIAGIIVTYANAPATLSDKPPAEDGAACVATPAARPQAGQNATLHSSAFHKQNKMP
jgi:hypothetical protein